ncbi:hypothetical protein HFO56_02645 [Rhizobium laguerreae]|uniref:hypothetical protein n=1 Tax=Rhizobium laguerreae TaxID=1076926 RepID=UPI001C90D392|nr:hypothetical protein [Rhizobium laguerreae]MBY3151284.1 hypothetical protein [Rhizobium laguerreae]
MKIDISLPFLTKGKPKRCASERDIYVTMPTTIDVPEVFPSQTETAFETFEHYALFAGSVGDPNKVRSGIELRAYEGRLYRKLFDVGSIADAAFHIAFDDTTNPKADDQDVSISTGFGYYGTNPLAGTLRRQIEWDLEKTSVSDGNVVLAWPTGSGPTTRLRNRNAAEFPSLAPSIEGIDDYVTETSMKRIEAQSAKLLVIGQDLWVACRPPCWRVEVNEDQVKIDLAIAIEGFDPLLSRRHFSLDRLEDARGYARKCAKANAVEGVQPALVEYIVDYDAPMPELMEFDADTEELSRIGYALAGECMRYGRGNVIWMNNLDRGLRQSLFAAYAATMETDYVQGRMGDVTPYIGDLCAVWRNFNRPLKYCELGPVRGKSGNLMIKEAKSLLENAPINLGTQFQSVLPRTPGAIQ